MKTLNSKTDAESLYQGEVTLVSMDSFKRCFLSRHTTEDTRRRVLQNLIGRPNFGGHRNDEGVWMPKVWLDEYELVHRQNEVRYPKIFRDMRDARRNTRKVLGHQVFSEKVRNLRRIL